MADKHAGDDGVTRLSFIKTSAGVAAGAAAVGVPAAVALNPGKPAVVTDPHTATPPEPVVAYVRDAQRGEVTVVSGTSEITYRDRALVKRLLNAAPSNEGGDLDVLAP